ncbi:LPXTG cell wall anchor domain-containing protein [Tabrizicola sp.]|uniref:LPXTG cell wall anchor domain-containing protein n=1 Tax=Tabrizicola sp. TaxID=2005166 RepID=UPI003F2E8D35
MRFIISFLFFTPFWMQFLIAGGFVYLGFDQRQETEAARTELLARLEEPPPATVPIADFQPEATGEAPREFSVSAQFASEHNTRLVVTDKGKTVDEDLMIVLVDPDAAADETIARAAIVFEPEQKDAMVGWLTANMTGEGGAGPVVTVTGLVTSSSKGSHVSDALRDQGMMKASDFFYVQPFIDGREAGLKAQIETTKRLDGSALFGIAGILALIGIAKLMFGRANSAATRETSLQGGATGGLLAPSSLHGLAQSPIASAASQNAGGMPDWAAGRNPGETVAARFAQSATTPQLPRSSGPQPEYLEVPANISTASLERIARKDRKPAELKLGSIVGVMVLVLLAASYMGGEWIQSRIVGQFAENPIVEQLSKAESTAPTATSEAAPVVDQPQPDAEARPATGGFTEPSLSTMGLMFFIALGGFIIVQRRKANRF